MPPRSWNLAEIASRGAVQRRPERGVDLGHVRLDTEVAPVPVGAEDPLEQAVEPRLAGRVAGRLQEAPVEGSRFASRRPTIVERLPRLVDRAGVERLRGFDLFRGQAVVGGRAGAGQSGRVEIAVGRIGDERIGLQPVLLRAAGCDGRLVRKASLASESLCPGFRFAAW